MDNDDGPTISNHALDLPLSENNILLRHWSEWSICQGHTERPIYVVYIFERDEYLYILQLENLLNFEIEIFEERQVHCWYEVLVPGEKQRTKGKWV